MLFSWEIIGSASDNSAKNYKIFWKKQVGSEWKLSRETHALLNGPFELKTDSFFKKKNFVGCIFYMHLAIIGTFSVRSKCT